MPYIWEKEWWTGRSEKEADVYANFDQVATVVSNIKKIKTNEVSNAQDELHAAIEALNNVNGMAQYVGTYPANAFDEVYASVGTAVVEIADQLNAKANDIKTYSESTTGEKILSSLTMGLAKFGEGALSVAEDLGDGVVSIVGRLAPAESGLEKKCAEFVQKDWSHDAFNFYYNSEFAKKSAFTEDSGIAGTFKLAGTAVGYLYAGGVFSGAGGALGIGKTGLGKLALHAASGSTWGATMAAGLGGLGSGTENGLNQGKSFDDAFDQNGVRTAALQAGLAFAGGKLGERAAKRAATKAVEQADEAVDAASTAVNEADDAYNAAYNEWSKLSGKEALAQEEVLNKAIEQTGVARETLSAAVDKAAIARRELQEGLEKGFQGYSDAVSQAGNRFGASAINTGKTGLKALSTTAAASKAVITKSPDAAMKTVAAEQAQTAFRQTGKDFVLHSNPVAQVAKTTYSGGKSLVNGVRNLPSTLSGAKDSLDGLAVGLRHAPDATIKNLASEALTSVGKIAANPATPGVVGAGVYSTVNTGLENLAHVQSRMMDQQGLANVTPSSDPSLVPEGAGGSIYRNPLVETTTDPGTDHGTYPNPNPNPGTYQNPDPKTTPGTETDPKPDPGTGTDPKKDPETGTDPKKDPGTETDPKKDPGTGTDPKKDPGTGTDPKKDPGTGTNPKQDPGTGGGSHSGGGYSGSGGYSSYGGYNSSDGGGYNSSSDLITTAPESIDEAAKEAKNSIDEIIKGNKYTKIPTAKTPISTNKTSGGGSSVIPIAAGLSAAAAAGIGAKAYMDKKNNREESDEYDDDIEEWSDEDTIDLNDNTTEYDTAEENDTYLDEDDEYGYQTEEVEKYGARNSEELADLQ